MDVFDEDERASVWTNFGELGVKFGLRGKVLTVDSDESFLEILLGKMVKERSDADWFVSFQTNEVVILGVNLKGYFFGQFMVKLVLAKNLLVNGGESDWLCKWVEGLVLIWGIGLELDLSFAWEKLGDRNSVVIR